MPSKSEVIKLQEKVAELEKENQQWSTIYNAIIAMYMGTADTLKINPNARTSTRVYFREQEQYVACAEQIFEVAPPGMFKSRSDFNRAIYRGGLFLLSIFLRGEAEKGDIHYGMDTLKAMPVIEKMAKVMMKLQAISYDNYLKALDKMFNELKNDTIQADNVNMNTVDELIHAQDELEEIYKPDFNVNVDKLDVPNAEQG